MSMTTRHRTAHSSSTTRSGSNHLPMASSTTPTAWANTATATGRIRISGRPDPDSGYVYGLDGVQTVLYNLEDVMQAALRGEMVVWVEGEKDADNGKERLGLTTTTCPMGAKHFKPHYPGFLMGADVVVVADNDGPGREHAEMVARELLPFAASVKILDLPDLPENGDLTDWIDAGGTREEFERLTSLPQPYIPGGDGDDMFGAVRFADLGEPEPRTFVVEDLVPQ